jgi:hypothetical protein
LTGVVKGLFGGDSASKRQERLLRKQEADLKAVEAGQKKVRDGGKGLLAFLDDEEGAALGGLAAGSAKFGDMARRLFGGLS